MPSIDTSKIFRDHELDQGFILRANKDVAKILQTAIKDEQVSKEDSKRNPCADLALTLLDANKRTYGLTIANRLYLCSLVDMPCIVEAMKTLDQKTFFKSCDAAQMMYVHEVFLEEVDTRSDQEIKQFAKDFNPIDDEEFRRDLFQRK